jgi:hypothetical protein
VKKLKRLIIIIIIIIIIDNRKKILSTFFSVCSTDKGIIERCKVCTMKEAEIRVRIRENTARTAMADAESELTSGGRNRERNAPTKQMHARARTCLLHNGTRFHPRDGISLFNFHLFIHPHLEFLIHPRR